MPAALYAADQLQQNIGILPPDINESTEKYEVIGNGNKITNQYPKSNTIVNGKVFLLTNDNNINIPNLVGYSRKDAINLMKLLNLHYDIEGNGYVYEYSVEVDKNNKPAKVKLKLSDKYQE